MEKIVAIIPARGGSKGIPKKNTRLLEGKPLIAHIIQSALACASIDRTIVSTEDESISKIAQQYGAEVPFIRPFSLAGDAVLTAPVLLHAANWLSENEHWKPDIIVLLYPTSPLLSAEIIELAIQKIKNHPNVDSVASFCWDDKYHWTRSNGHLKRWYPDRVMRRQEMSPLLVENGALYIMRYQLLHETGHYIGGRIEPIMMDPKDSWDIDEEQDFKIVEAILAAKKAQFSVDV